MIQDLAKRAKVIVCVGSGGVGKTTVASAIGLSAAQDGKRVLVLTVDPARRLKTTMGLGETTDIVEITPPGPISGKLFASVIDPKQTFDEFVKKASNRPELVEKMMQNKLYQQLSTTLNGSQEFTALEKKLYSCYESNQYDLIVLDTPPTKHAIDFLEAPQRLAALFNEGVAKWFRDPSGKSQNFLVSLLSAGTKQVLKALELLTGSEFISELSSFFQSLEQWQTKLESRVIDSHQLLVSPTTHFVLVTSFDEAKLAEAENFGREIRKGGYQLSGLVINRAYPHWFADKDKPVVSELSSLYDRLKTYYRKREEVFGKFSGRMSAEAFILRVPELPKDVSDLAGVALVSKWLRS